MLKAWLDLPNGLEPPASIPLDDVTLNAPRIDDPVLRSLRRLLPEDAIRTDKLARAQHACGRSYRNLVCCQRGLVPNPPDVVVYPADEGQVAGVVAWAADREVAIIPFGGGTSLTNGIEPEPERHPTVTMDLSRLNHLVSLNTDSWTARIQAGARGPELEAALNARGFTLGHFPHSFECSTLGGWIATRSAGQAATGYGTIEALTQAVRMVSPTGILETKNIPAAATGPSLLHLALGSEGAYGVITEATMRVRPQPEAQEYHGVLFHRLTDGLNALRDLVQQGTPPTVVSLSDAADTAVLSMLSHEPQGWRWLADRGIEAYLSRRGYAPNGESCLLIVGYEGEATYVKNLVKQAVATCRTYDGFHLGQAAGESWKRDRFIQPYLRDTILAMGMMVDTLDTATTWSNAVNLYEVINAAINAAIPTCGGGSGHVMTRFGHATPGGISLTTTFWGRRMPGQEIEQWWEIKQAATEAILEAEGTLSHHQGIGRDRVPWLGEEIGPVGMAVLKALKRTLDPEGIMNPGVLVP